MRFLLGAALIGGVVASANAANYDTRLYVSPAVGYLLSDPGRGVDNDLDFSVTAGLPISATRNYEVSLSFDDLNGTSIYGLNAGMLTYFDPNQPRLFSLINAGLLSIQDDIGDNYFSPNITAGLGLMLPGGPGSLRLEGLLRADLHYNEEAGLGGKKAFIEPIVRLGYHLPLGPEPQVETPREETVDIVAPAGDDSDSDGITDSHDLCPGTPLGTVVDGSGCAVKTASSGQQARDCREPALDEAVDEFGCAVDRSVILNGVNFEFDSDILTDQAQLILEDVATVLQGMPGTTAEIAGHTSDEGDEYYNLDLSQRRASAVRNYLIDAGVSATQLQAKGYGGKAPLTANDSYSGRRENRRVEIKIVK